MTAAPPPGHARAGVAAGLATFLAWGVLPLYYKWFGAVPAEEIVAHRIVWSLAVTGLLVVLTRRLGDVERVLRRRRQLWVFALSAAMILLQWVVYIWAVGAGRLVEASTGYYIYPLASVLLGAVVLGERLGVRQRLAVGLVGAGVALLVLRLGTLPWIALTLAFTLAIYGLLRKQAAADSLVGLFLETLLLAPLALAWLATRPDGGAVMRDDAAMVVMLMLTGPATALPLLTFAFAARRMALSTLGLMQYLNPTCQMMVAVLIFGEAFTATHAASFAFIWLGLAIYSLDALRRQNDDGQSDGRNSRWPAHRK